MYRTEIKKVIYLEGGKKFYLVSDGYVQDDEKFIYCQYYFVCWQDFIDYMTENCIDYEIEDF